MYTYLSVKIFTSYAFISLYWNKYLFVDSIVAENIFIHLFTCDKNILYIYYGSEVGENK